ncbi:uncharacterized protein LOC110731618 [Chenopodium quinoa]|uniref:TMEM205-like domain-containing protein n=1 Tax=Chenopodium quinoa TaxID=63459 RepID=A0A803M351_CHEQI|nr:uncharacterized protein LOC110731618 [Chenopodium quinoa]
MMNLIAISLIATSIVVSGLFSPNPQNNGGKGDQVIVKGGHRAVVVEYGDDVGDGNTKVLIKSSQEHAKDPGPGPVDEQISRAAASVAGVAQDVKGKAHDVVTGQTGPHGARPRELICDAYGKCKHKIAGVWGKTKEKAAEAEEVVEEVVEDVVDKAKGFASKAGRKAEETAEGVRDDVKAKARSAGETAERVRDKAGEKVRETGEKMRETGENVREKAEKVKGKTEEMVEETGEKIKEQSKKGKEEFIDISKRGKEVVFDVIRYVNGVGYVLVKETMSTLVGVSELLGIATAYGMAIWVTFINSHVLAGVLPRQQFGMVQSKIYPVYFKAMVGSIGLALLGHLLGHQGNMFKNKAHMLQAYNLMSSLLFVLGNLLFLEPRATKAMFERMKLDKEEGRGRDRVSTPTRVIDTVVSDSAGATPTTTATTTTTIGTTKTAPSKTSRSEQDKAKTKLAELNDRLKKLNSLSSFLNIMTLMGLTWHLVYLSQRLRANSC